MYENYQEVVANVLWFDWELFLNLSNLKEAGEINWPIYLN